MKVRSWKAAVLGTWLIALAAGVAFHHSGKRAGPWDQAAAPASVQLCGPPTDLFLQPLRMEAKRRIAHDVLVGRTPLLAAAAAFRRMDEPPPSWLRTPGCYNGANSKDEAYCRSVIYYVCREGPRERTDEATSRLEAELDAMLREGTLRLPDVRDANQTGDGTVCSGLRPGV